MQEVIVSSVYVLYEVEQSDFGGPKILSQFEALKRMMVFFRFGGVISDFEYPNKIVVTTKPWSGQDVHTLEGDNSAMKPFFQAAFSCRLWCGRDDAIVERLGSELFSEVWQPNSINVSKKSYRDRSDDETAKRMLMLSVGIESELDMVAGCMISFEELSIALDLIQDDSELALREILR